MLQLQMDQGRIAGIYDRRYREPIDSYQIHYSDYLAGHFIRGITLWIQKDRAYGTPRRESVQSTFNGLRLKPCIPAELDNTKITRQYRGATYHIHICFGKGSMVCDGQAVQGDTLPIFPAGTEHCVTVYTN